MALFSLASFRNVTRSLVLCFAWLVTLGTTAATEKSRLPKGVQLTQAAVVRIHVIEVDYEDGRETKQEGFGSGVIISPDGLLVTNHHVAGNGKYFTCTLTDKTEVDATLVGTDALTDLSVLKLQPTEPRKFPSAGFGDSSKLRVGDRIYAMGSPLTFDQSVTEGVVSNTALTTPEAFEDEWIVLDGEDIGAVLQWIAHDADIYPGNSGGPLVNSRGEIVGINEISFGLSGAIPGNLAKEIVQTLMSKGEVQRSWIGVTAQPLLETSSVKHGVLITGALADSPAAQAGFKSGDILLRIHGKAVDVRLSSELPTFNVLLMSLPISTPVEAVVWRDGKEQTLSVTPAVRPKAKQRPEELLQWGCCASNITPLQARELQRPGAGGGVLLVSMRPGGPADSAKPALSEGDVLIEVAGEQINTLADLKKITVKITDGHTEPVPALVVFERDAERMRTVVNVGIDPTHDPGFEVRKAWLPLSTQVLTPELVKALGLEEETTGVCITQVYPGTAAEKAGLKVGDIITALDGQAIEATAPEDTEVFPAMIRQYRIGTKAELTVIRDGKSQTIPVELPASPPLPREMPRYRDTHYEFSARNLAFVDRMQRGWPADQQGVLVEGVTGGGWASLGHLQGGDLIIAIDETPITDVETLKTQMEHIAQDHPRRIVVRVKRGTRNLFLEWRSNWTAQ